MKKKTLKWPIVVVTNLDCVTLGGAGGQTVETSSTFVVPLKTLEYNASNERCARSMPALLQTLLCGESISSFFFVEFCNRGDTFKIW